VRIHVWIIVATLLPASASATQIVPGHIEYSNDRIEQTGQLQACIVTVVIVSPPAPEVVNFQFIATSNGGAGFKIAAGDMNWSVLRLEPRRVLTGNVSGFGYGDVFEKNLTAEGQLVGVLHPGLYSEYSAAFFAGRYLIQFRRADHPDEERSYYIEQQPELEILDTFRLCVSEMTDQHGNR
jgi:hypothetical protein